MLDVEGKIGFAAQKLGLQIVCKLSILQLTYNCPQALTVLRVQGK